MTSARDQLKAESKKSELEETFAGQLRYLFMENGWDQDAVRREYRFHPYRKWRADFAIDSYTSKMGWGFSGKYYKNVVLIEIDGGTWSQGRHTRGTGFRNDAEKFNAAQLLGYTVLRFDSTMVRDGLAIRTVERLLKGEIDDGDED